MYFLSKFYRSIKFTFASLGAVGSTLAIIYGALSSGGTVFIIGGSISLVNSLFNFWEIGKVSADILKQVNNLNGRIDDFANQNELQKENVKTFGEKNQELKMTIGDLILKMKDMEHSRSKSVELQKELSKNLDLEQTQVVVLTDQNEELKGQLEKLDVLKDQLNDENEEYYALIQKGRQQIEDIENILTSVTTERDELNENNEIMNTQILKQMEIIRESKALIVNLSNFGDKYQEFSSSIDTNLIKLEDTEDNLATTSNIIKNLVEKLQNQKFAEIDQDADGYVTKEEFQSALEKI